MGILVKETCRLTIFMLCAQAVISFRPKENYEKYLRLLMNLLIILQFLLPIREMLFGEQAGALWLERMEAEERITEKGWMEEADDGAMGEVQTDEVTMGHVLIEIDPVEITAVE